MSATPWYKRYPADFIARTLHLPLEVKGAYSVVLDLIYDRGRPLPDDPRSIARACGCSIRRWNQIKGVLLDAGHLQTTANGLWCPVIDSWANASGRQAIPARVRYFVFERDGGHCSYCGADVSESFHIDHAVPVAYGGGNDPDNLALACATCNLSKGARTPDEWQQ